MSTKFITLTIEYLIWIEKVKLDKKIQGPLTTVKNVIVLLSFLRLSLFYTLLFFFPYLNSTLQKKKVYSLFLFLFLFFIV